MFAPPTLPGWSSRSTVSRPPLRALLALICSPPLNGSPSTLFLPSALSDLLAFLSQWTPIADASLGFLTIQHRLSDCFFSLCLSLPRCASRGHGTAKKIDHPFTRNCACFTCFACPRGKAFMAEQQPFGDKEPFRGISLCSRLLLWWVRASVLLGLFCLEVTEQAGECLLVVVVLFPASEVSDVA